MGGLGFTTTFISFGQHAGESKVNMRPGHIRAFLKPPRRAAPTTHRSHSIFDPARNVPYSSLAPPDAPPCGLSPFVPPVQYLIPRSRPGPSVTICISEPASEHARTLFSRAVPQISTNAALLAVAVRRQGSLLLRGLALSARYVKI